MLKKTIIFLSLVMWLSPVARAADQDVLKCLDALTYGVIRLDTRAADFSESLDALLTLAGTSLKPLEAEHLRMAVNRSQTMMERDLGTFQEAGGRDIYALFNLRDMPGFVLVFPVDPGVNPNRLEVAIKTISDRSFTIADLAMVSYGRLILAGKQPSVEAVRAGAGGADSLWATLLDKQPVRPLRIAVIPNEAQLRVLKEMWPNVPAMPGLDQFKTLVQQCRWLTLSVQIVPHMAFEASLEMQTGDTADRAAALWKTMAPTVAQTLDMDVTVLDQIQVGTHGQQVTWSLNHVQAQEVLGSLFLSPVQKLVSYGQRMICGSNVSDMGKAILIYANDHHDQLPPSLNILTEKDKMHENSALPEKALICPGAGKKDSYGYCGDGLDCNCAPDLMIVYDKKGNHAEPYRNVLFMDSHIEWIPEARFPALAAQVNAVRKERGLAEHVFE